MSRHNPHIWELADLITCRQFLLDGRGTRFIAKHFDCTIGLATKLVKQTRARYPSVPHIVYQTKSVAQYKLMLELTQMLPPLTLAELHLRMEGMSYTAAVAFERRVREENNLPTGHRKAYAKSLQSN